MSTLETLGRGSAHLIRGILLGVLTAVCLITLGPVVLGQRTYTVLSGSMSPQIDTGDMVVTKPIRPAVARAGQIVTFVDPEDRSRLINHRVVSVRRGERRVAFVTRGDANTSTERWTVPRTGSIGLVQYLIPKLGYALFWTRGRIARLALLLIPALVLAALLIHSVWRPDTGAAR